MDAIELQSLLARIDKALRTWSSLSTKDREALRIDVGIAQNVIARVGITAPSKAA